MWILAFSCAFVAGVAIGATGEPAWSAVLCPAIAFAFMLTRRTRTTIAVLLSGALLFALLGAVRYEGSLPVEGNSLVSYYNDSGKVEFEAIVSEEPEDGGRYTRVLLDDVRIRVDGHLRPVDGRVLVTTADPRPLHYGDAILFSGSLETPQPFDGFDYAGYLALSGVYSTAFHANLEVLPAKNTRPVRARLLVANTALAKALSRMLPEPEASLAQSLLLGRRGSLPSTVVDAFARTGTAHLLAISGLHLGVVVAAVLAVLLGTMGRRHYLYVWLGLAALWAYALFTGMKPPVVRAAIMASTFLVAELAGRQKHAPTALALAAAIMVGIEPQLLWRTSFQLSVLAMGGLVLLFPPFRSLLGRGAAFSETRLGLHLPGTGAAMDIVAATLAASVAVLPVCAMIFEQFSVVGVPVSLLTLPVLPLALGSASLAAVVALSSTTLAAPFAWVAWLFLSFIIRTVEVFSALPWAALDVSARGGWLLAGYYAILCAVPILWLKVHRLEDGQRLAPKPATGDDKPGWLRYALPPLVLAATLTWAAVLSAPDGRLHVLFLDVGQGDCVLVQSPTGRTVLIDGGPDGQTTCTLIDSHRPFWDRSIDVVVTTHPHVDHLGGLLSVVERYDTGVLLEPAISGDSLMSEEWRRRLGTHDCSSLCVSAGYEVLLGDGTRLEVLNPGNELQLRTSDDLDNNGVLIRLTYGAVSFLLTADIRAEGERQLVHLLGPQLHSQVLKVPHHGSGTSSTEQFVAAVGPQVAVISVGEGNAYGHPHEDVLSRLRTLGVHVLTTQDCGTVEFITDGQELWVSTEKPTELLQD
jgi:competence protein ComEC